MTNNEHPEGKKNRESSIRWQGRTIEQFGYSLNLILGLAVAAMGFELSILLNKELERDVWQNCLFATSMLSLLVSVAVGLGCVINRLRDFRATTQTAREREDGKSALELLPLRSFTRSLGNRTWLLFWWQIGTFGVGVLLLVVAVVGVVAKTMAT